MEKTGAPPKKSEAQKHCIIIIISSTPSYLKPLPTWEPFKAGGQHFAGIGPIHFPELLGAGAPIQRRRRLRQITGLAPLQKNWWISSGWWLWALPIWKRLEFVNWDDEIPNENEKIKVMFQTTNQSWIFGFWCTIYHDFVRNTPTFLISWLIGWGIHVHPPNSYVTHFLDGSQESPAKTYSNQHFS